MPNLVNSSIFGSYVGPLDIVPSATWAYSLRKLSSSYSGYCMRVRRASDNATQDIGFINNFVDTAAILAFCTDQTGEVDIWYDQSGSGNNFVGAGPGGSPIICQVGSITTNTYNSQPALHIPDITHIKIAGNISATICTTWSVCLQTTQIFRYFFRSALSKFMASTYASSVPNRIILEKGAFAIGNGTTVPVGTPMIFQTQFNNTSSFYNINGIPGGALSPSNPGSGNIGQLSIGLDWTAIDYYQEFIGWGDALNSTQIANVQTNINSYYMVY